MECEYVSICFHGAMFEIDAACVSVCAHWQHGCARSALFVDDAFVFACESADFSDLGRLLSCWKHTAAHQIFTAPSNSGLHGLPSTGPGAVGHRQSERGEKHQHARPRRTTNTQ